MNRYRLKVSVRNPCRTDASKTQGTERVICALRRLLNPQPYLALLQPCCRTRQTGLPDDHRVLEPPDPMPNSEVKRYIADGSVGSPHVRVGHRQAPKLKRPVGMPAGRFTYVRSHMGRPALYLVGPAARVRPPGIARRRYATLAARRRKTCGFAPL